MPDEHKSFTPYELVHIISLHSAQIFERDFIIIRGIYSESKTFKDYNGFSYYAITDEASKKKLKAKIPQAVRARLKPDYCYEFEGVLERQAYSPEELNVYLCFNVTAVKNEKPVLTTDEIEEKHLILQGRNDKPRNNIESLLNGIFNKNDKPRIALVSGEDVQTRDDVYDSIDDRQDSYILEDVKANLYNKLDIVEKLKKAEGKGTYDLIALYRGGGNGVEIFEDTNIARAVLDLRIPVIAAIGHSEDRPLSQQVTDREFITPSAIGTYLRDCANSHLEKNKLKNELKNKEHWFHEQINTKDKAYANLRGDLTRTLSLHEASQTEINQLKTKTPSFKNRSLNIKRRKIQYQTLRNLGFRPH